MPFTVKKNFEIAGQKDKQLIVQLFLILTGRGGDLELNSPVEYIIQNKFISLQP